MSQWLLRYISPLTMLAEVQEPAHLFQIPVFRAHPLKGIRLGTWSISISGNWRITFRFEDREVVNVDWVAYH